MPRLSPTLSTLPPELKSLIARMARDQDELFRAPAYSLLSNTSATDDEDLRNELSQAKDGGRSLYGSSLPMLALVSRDWRDAASKYLNETMNSWQLFLVQSERHLMEQDGHASGSNQKLSAYERVKARVRRAAYDADDFSDDDEDRPRTIAEAFIEAVAVFPEVGKRITSLTVAFHVIDSSGAASQRVLAGLITSLPSLDHLRLIDAIEVFHHPNDKDGLEAALDGAQHLTSLSLRLSADYVYDDPEELEEIFMVKSWLKWKPRLKSFDIVANVFGGSVPSFIAAVAPTLEHLSLTYKHLRNDHLYPPNSRPPFFNPTPFPLLSHLELTGDENDFILESILGSPISHLHLTSTSDASCLFLADPSTLDQYLPTLHHLRLDSEPTRPRTSLADLRERCEDAGVVLHVGPSSTSGRANLLPLNTPPDAIQDASGETERLLERALEQARCNTAAGDKVRTAELTKALQGLRVLLKMQTE